MAATTEEGAGAAEAVKEKKDGTEVEQGPTEGLDWKELEDVATEEEQMYSQLFHHKGFTTPPMRLLSDNNNSYNQSYTRALSSPLESLTRLLDFDRYSLQGSEVAASSVPSSEQPAGSGTPAASGHMPGFYPTVRLVPAPSEIQRQSSVVEWLTSQPGRAEAADLQHFDLPSSPLELDTSATDETMGSSCVSSIEPRSRATEGTAESKLKDSASEDGATVTAALSPTLASQDLITDMVDVLVLGDETGIPKPTATQSIRSQSFASGHDENTQEQDFNTISGIEEVSIPSTEQASTSALFQRHTVYCLEIRYTNSSVSTIKRRFSDFVGFEKMLQLAAPYPVPYPLPECWRELQQAKKMFGQRSNTVVENRRKLLERCIQSLTSRVLHPNHIPIVQAFLTPELEESQFALTAKQNLHTHQEKIKQTQKVEHRSAVVRLLVNPPGQHHSMNEQLAIQAGLCRGCHDPFPVATNHTTMPILCEYTGEYFCSKCHRKKKCILPNYAIHKWDFAPRPVWTEAKAFLDSTWDKPILCVNAINPYLYNTVPALSLCHDHRIRLNELQKKLPPSAQAALAKTLERRKYLMENSDFYAMSELADLARGKRLNKWLEKIIMKCEMILQRIEKIQEHKQHQQQQLTDGRETPEDTATEPSGVDTAPSDASVEHQDNSSPRAPSVIEAT